MQDCEGLALKNVASWYSLQKHSNQDEQTKMTKPATRAMCALILAIGVSGCASSGPTSMQVYRALENKIDRLDARVDQLEADRSVNTSEAQANHEAEVVATQPQSSSNPWRRLRTGLSMDQVRGLLGEPDKVTQVYDGRIHWRYDGRPGFAGQVEFEDGRVEGWREPG
ncbi:hypothetical protein [Halomonas sp.]|uniref:hypothetical protein n=1 Tax=Halomonas sp. TaxID=1486246 RepID=UPI00384C5481